MEVNIETKSTTKQKFARCNNTKCKAIFLFEPREIISETGLLCPTCRLKMDTHHTVQCKICQSVINFVDADPSEEPVVFYTEKCSLCTGSSDDEKIIEPCYFPEAFI
ncbi:MAG: hypothetical protein CVV23_13810 [Ignavibacteriae bacterium HGW-Ignavibacteriae-2]|jgi:hypothetical protein|nr:MAG: hypothetical protein CVV23_13810 [Ignavibacteriae bacterium HGW-Ignavibacteriae-2]